MIEWKETNIYRAVVMKTQSVPYLYSADEMEWLFF